MKDRIEITYQALDEMIACHGKEKPENFGGGLWDAMEEFNIYSKQVWMKYTDLQWGIIELYFCAEMKEKHNIIVKFPKKSAK